MPKVDSKVVAPKPDIKVAEPKKPEAVAKTDVETTKPAKVVEPPVPLPPPREKAAPASPPHEQTAHKDSGDNAAERQIKRKPPRTCGAHASTAPARCGTSRKAPGH